MNILQQCRPRKYLSCNVYSRNSSQELKNAVSSNLLSHVWQLTQLSTWWDSESLRRWDTLVGILSIRPIGVKRPTHRQWHPSPEGDPNVHKREKAHWAQTLITPSECRCNVTGCLNLELQGLDPWTVSPNRPFLPQVAFARVFYHSKGKTLRN